MFLSILILFIAIIIYKIQNGWEPKSNSLLNENKLMVIGHRGSPLEEPENTVKSFIKATQAEIDEMDLNSLRGYRNGLLSQSDWMANSDSPEMTDEWKTYRQALRDITKTYKNEREVVWPTPPS